MYAGCHCLLMLLLMLLRGSKAVLFVLDHFERFAARSKQAVLYTLLDCLQAANMQAHTRIVIVWSSQPRNGLPASHCMQADYCC